MEKVIILGTGPAGLSAAIYAARAALKPLVIEGPHPGGQLLSALSVENFPGFPHGVDTATLMQAMREQAENFGARLQAGEVAKVDFSQAALRVDLLDGQRHEARAIIIATGAGAVYLGLKSEQQLLGRGVSACATCDGALYRDKSVAVVGGGDSAMQEALFLTRFASHVTIIHRRDQFRASKIMTARVLNHPKIQVVWNSVVDEVLGVAQQEVVGLRLKHVQTGALSELPVTGVFIAIGHRPNTALFVNQVAMNPLGYIITDHTRTNLRGVFAAGDVQDQFYRQAVIAAGTGCMAALEAERYLKEA